MRINFIPHEYQKPVLDHILDSPRGGVWMGMGMGKTTAALSALEMLYFAGMETKPALVLAPLRVAQSTWPDEAEKWEHLRNIEVQPIVGSVEARQAALWNTNASVFSINYENIPWLIEYLNGKWPFGPIIADESTRLKSYRSRQGGQRARALSAVAFKHPRFIELTGTPSPNGLKDLWGQAWFLDQGERLGRSYSAFTMRWFEKGFDGFSVKPRPHAQAEIEGKLKDICLSLQAKDYFDLKEPIVSKVFVNLPGKARKLYREMEKEMYIELEGIGVEAFNSASKTGKCHQLANGAAYVGDAADRWVEVHDVKIQALESIVEEAAGMPVLVAYHFRSDLDRLRKAFPKARVLDKNPQTIRDWNAGKIKVLFAHPASAGHGLNLQDGGNILVYFSIDWNLEYHEQILERIGPTRQMQAGHDRPVFVYMILARDTVDDHLILPRLETKASVQQVLMNAMKRRAA